MFETLGAGAGKRPRFFGTAILGRWPRFLLHAYSKNHMSYRINELMRNTMGPYGITRITCLLTTHTRAQLPNGTLPSVVA
jgi:hypothetical protein